MIKASCNTYYFRTGRNDVLEEMYREMKAGTWTPTKRAELLREARSTRNYLRCTRPSLTQTSAYYTGRVAGLQSRFSTLNFDELPPLPEQDRHDADLDLPFPIGLALVILVTLAGIFAITLFAFSLWLTIAVFVCISICYEVLLGTSEPRPKA